MLTINLFNGLVYGTLLIIMCSGLALIYGLRRVVNFAHGSLYMLGAYLGYSIAVYGNFWLALIAVPAIMAFIGVLLDRYGFRLLQDRDPLTVVLVTFGLLLIIMMIFRPTGILPEPRRRIELQHASHVGHLHRPRPDLVVNPRACGRPATVDRADVRRADHPVRVLPAVGQHVEHLLGFRRDEPPYFHHSPTSVAGHRAWTGLPVAFRHVRPRSRRRTVTRSGSELPPARGGHTWADGLLLVGVGARLRRRSAAPAPREPGHPSGAARRRRSMADVRGRYVAVTGSTRRHRTGRGR